MTDIRKRHNRKIKRQIANGMLTEEQAAPLFRKNIVQKAAAKKYMPAVPGAIMEDSEQEPNCMAQGVQNFIQEVQNFGPVWSTPSISLAHALPAVQRRRQGRQLGRSS